jgi:hypothetical protein
MDLNLAQDFDVCAFQSLLIIFTPLSLSGRSLLQIKELELKHPWKWVANLGEISKSL